VQLYLPKFPYEGVTVKDLLTHRSGLPNYLEFMEGGTKVQYVRKLNKRGKSILVRSGVNKSVGFEGLATNQDVLDWMIAKRPPIDARPNRVFKYCNTNYVLLALIVEKVTGTPFPQFMKDSVFTPLGMTNTFIFTKKDIPNFNPSYMGQTPQRVEKFDCVYGDKCVYSTVRDMLQWDKALYEGNFVSKPTLDMAFKGYSNEHRGERNYGLGWRLLIGPSETIVYHNGWWHGNNTVFTRLVKDSATLIILGNKFNKNIYAAHKITSVFNGSVDTTSMVE
jgi:CubicO group peptidase (beta-lactamase class C family)